MITVILCWPIQNDTLFQQELLAHFGEDYYTQQLHQYQYDSKNDVESGEHSLPGNESASDRVMQGVASMGSEIRKKMNSFTLKYLADKSRDPKSEDGDGITNDGAECSTGRSSSVSESISNIGHKLRGGLMLGVSGDPRVNDKEVSVNTGNSIKESSLLQESDDTIGFSGLQGDEEDDDEMETINLLSPSDPRHTNHDHCVQAPSVNNNSNNNSLSNIWSSMVRSAQNKSNNAENL